MSERCERTSERTSEWLSTSVCILGCSGPPCSLSSASTSSPSFSSLFSSLLLFSRSLSIALRTQFSHRPNHFLSTHRQPHVPPLSAQHIFQNTLLPHLLLPAHCGSEQPRVQTEVLGHLLVLSLVCSLRLLVCLLCTACFARVLFCAHSLAQLAHARIILWCI